MSLAIVSVALTLILVPLLLASPLLRPGLDRLPSEQFLAAEGWPTVAATYVAPVPPPALALRPQPTLLQLPAPQWQEMSHLTVIEFMLSTVVDVQRTTEVAILGDLVTDRLLLKAAGEVQLGLDLSQVTDVQVAGNAIRFTAPKPQIISVELLPERSQIFGRQQAFLLSNYTGLETEALEMARRQLRAEVAATPSMMALAEEYGRLQLRDFLHKLGYAEVEITFVEGVNRP